MFCFTFVSDHNTDNIILYSVQLKGTATQIISMFYQKELYEP